MATHTRPGATAKAIQTDAMDAVNPATPGERESSNNGQHMLNEPCMARVIRPILAPPRLKVFFARFVQLRLSFYFTTDLT